VLARSVLALSLLSAPCAWGADAPEPSAEQSATELKARADAAMDGGAYADAITSYRASYELSRNPALLYNIGNAYERLGDYPRALAYLEQFALVAPIGLRARVPALPELIASVRGRLARVAVGCNVPGARVLVRGSWQGTTPLTASISTMPGPARVEVVADGYQPFARDVVLSAGKETRFDAVLVSSGLFTNVSREAAPPAKDGGLTTKWWFWTGVGLVVAGGAAIAVVALTTNHAPPAEPSASHTQAALVSW
jgi:hypothetical protein